MTRRVLFQIHWFLGITAGLVLALMGVTGAMMSFEDEIMAGLSPDVVRVAPSSATPLTPDALMAAVSRAHGGDRVNRIIMHRDPGQAAELLMAPPKGKRRGELVFADPRTGALLGTRVGEGFFRTVMDLHRWLALPGGANGIGRQITGFAALALVFFALSGLYLRWPRRPLDWRAWLVLDLRKTGRNLYRALHAVIGGWLLLFYLVSALTGLTWSYQWYSQGAEYLLTGKSGGREHRPRPAKDGPIAVLDPAWATFLTSEGARYDQVTIMVPAAGKPIAMNSVPRGARFDRMSDELRFAPGGQLQKATRYADRSIGETIAANFYPIHTGAFFGLPGRIALLLSSLTMPLFTVTGFLLYFARRRAKRALAAVAASPALERGGSGDDMIVVHASQTGNAERIARLSAAAFPGASVRALDSLDLTELAAARRALFVVATYGEGHAPDRARRFEGRAMAAPLDLGALDYAVLALGDREYPDFCAFGHRVDRWLHDSGAGRLFDTIELDGTDLDAERHWQQQLGAVAGAAIQPDWRPADYQPWTLTAREHVNPGSPGAPVFRIFLTPPESIDWAPGSIAEVMPRHDPDRVDRWLLAAGRTGDAALRATLQDAILPDPAIFSDRTVLRPLAHRDYSIASVASDNMVELLVRTAPAADGGHGIGSGWLTHVAQPGEAIRLRVRGNPGFAPPGDPAVPLILIGNGTGLAGLIAHLRDRDGHGGGGPAWLLYGERTLAHDRPYAAELDALAERGILARLDLAFSRDKDCGRYVQHLVAEAAAEIADWVDRGAAIYVCGSLIGMAGDVDAALRTALGDARVESMLAERRYCRDIY